MDYGASRFIPRRRRLGDPLSTSTSSTRMSGFSSGGSKAQLVKHPSSINSSMMFFPGSSSKQEMLQQQHGSRTRIRRRSLEDDSDDNEDFAMPQYDKSGSRRSIYSDDSDDMSFFSGSNRSLASQFSTKSFMFDVEKSRNDAKRALAIRRSSTNSMAPYDDDGEGTSEYASSTRTLRYYDSSRRFSTTELKDQSSSKLSLLRKNRRDSQGLSSSMRRSSGLTMTRIDSKAALMMEVEETKSMDSICSSSYQAKNNSKATTCDKCDSKSHDTESCPWFKKKREDHADALRRKPMNIGADGKIVYLRNAKVVTMPGDGSCLFHSLSYGLGTSKARRLRKDIAEFISQNPNLSIAETPLKEWVKWDSGKSVRQYANRMAISGWGGGIECAACSHLFKVNVHIYERSSRFSARGNYKRISCFDYPGAKKTINVLYCGGVHYNALVL